MNNTQKSPSASSAEALALQFQVAELEGRQEASSYAEVSGPSGPEGQD